MGRIVRAGEAPADAPDARADGVVAARAEAEALLASAREEADRIRAEALAAARHEGAAAAEASRAAVEAERSRLRAEADSEIVSLALAVAAKVLACAVEDGRAAVESARKALARARKARAPVVRVHPADADALRKASPELRAGLVHADRLELREDPEVGRGGAVVETETASVDARIESQLAAIQRRLGEAG